MPQSELSKLQAHFTLLIQRTSSLLLALAVGLAVAVVSIVFFETVSFITPIWRQDLPTDLEYTNASFSFTLAMSLLISALLAGYFLTKIKDGRPHGPADLILAAQKEEAPDLKVGMYSSVLALVNLSGGASVGIFGPLVHLGGCVSEFIHKKIERLPKDVVLGCGGGAAIAAIFAAPIGAAVFAHETIIRRFGAFGTVPVIIACFTAFEISDLALGSHRMFSVMMEPTLDFSTLFYALLLGLVSGLLSIAYILLITGLPKIAKATKVSLIFRPLIPATLLFLISPVLPHILGTGSETVALAMSGSLSVGLMVALIIGKLFLTPICLGFGFFGGVFAPALFIGSMLGSLWDFLFLTSGQTSFALVGAASIAAATLGSPLAAIIIVFEMTGSYEGAVLSMLSVSVACHISRLFVGRSLFDRQLSFRGINLKDDHI